MTDYSNRWMLSEAFEVLARAERLHRQFFEPARTGSASPAWQPPADVLETDQEVVVILALPGVDPEDVVAVIDDGELTVVGQRVLPPQLQSASIHRLELPQGRFERRLRLPPGRYGEIQRAYIHGCFVVSLAKMGVRRG
jgi:HSP20 family protein